MPDQFDPYHKWLAIPPSEQPPNHYRLLGLPLFESDQEVIAAAAGQRMNFVRKFAEGPYCNLADNLIKEVTDAWACLINSDHKRQYDDALRRQLQSPPNPMLQPPAPISAVPLFEPFAFEDDAAPTQNSFPLEESNAANRQIRPQVDAPFGVNISPPARRRARGRKQSSGAELVKIVISGMVVLTLGYLILCQVTAQRESPSAASAVLQTPQPAPPRVTPKPDTKSLSAPLPPAPKGNPNPPPVGNPNPPNILNSKGNGNGPTIAAFLAKQVRQLSTALVAMVRLGKEFDRFPFQSLRLDGPLEALLRSGKQWVSRQELRDAIRFLATNDENIGFIHLKRASHIDPESEDADFVQGVWHAVVNRDYKNAKKDFQECVNRHPNDPAALNNLAVAEVMSSEFEDSTYDAFKNFKKAVDNRGRGPELDHNLKRVVDIKLLRMSEGLRKKFEELRVSSATVPSVEERGWLYILPGAQTGKTDESAFIYALLAETNKFSIDPARPQGWIQDRICMTCWGHGTVACPTCEGKGTVRRQVINEYPDGRIRDSHPGPPVPCDRCSGTGRIPCTHCPGSGIDPDLH